MSADHIKPTPEQQAAAHEIRDKIFALIDAHDKEAHGGEPCTQARAGFIGWLCHCLGVHTGDDFHIAFAAAIAAEIEDYQHHHDEHGRVH